MLKRLGLVAALCITPLSIFAYSNVIVFGDSLSDIGNMPESPGVSSKAFKGAVALNLYVPISNPIVNSSGKNLGSYKVPGTGVEYTYPEPTNIAQPPLTVAGKQYQRNYKSLAWPQFFVHEAYLQHKVATDNIQPWIYWLQHPVNENLSLDYAFSGAVTDNLCRNFEYADPNANCTEQSILAGQQKYRDSGFNSKLGDQEDATQIPGLLKQVSLFHQDRLRDNKIANNKTLYVIFIGGNDINLALLDLKKKERMKAFSRVLFGAESRVEAAITQLITQDNAKNIVVMNLLDMEQSPYIQHDLLDYKIVTPKEQQQLLPAADLVIRLYNRRLFNLTFSKHFIYDTLGHENIKIAYFDTYAAVENMGMLPEFSNPKVKTYMCLKNKMSAEYYVAPQPCTTKNGNYIFWNGVHPSSFTHEYIGDRLLAYLTANY
jgi:phospholipase/lecithinase/hemolysin